MFTLEEGMHKPEDMITIEHLMQAIIHLKKENDKIVVKADGIPGLGEWKELSQAPNQPGKETKPVNKQEEKKGITPS